MVAETADPAPAQDGTAPPPPSTVLVGTALLLLVGGGLAIWQGQGARLAVLYGLGALFGLVLYHAAFGFASGWRRLVANGEGDGLRAQMLMLGVATLVFFPILSSGAVLGRPVAGAVAPVGISVAAGAFVFGIGMQLAGACASGTLYTVGGGSTRMVIVLVFFMVGSVIGSAHLPWWLALPSLGSVSLPDRLGLLPALVLQLTVFAAVALMTLVVERRLAPRRKASPVVPPAGACRRLLQGPWPLLAGALALALLNGVTLALAGHPWTISFGYTLWGAKLASAAGLDLTDWTFWTWRYPSRALAGSVFANTTSVMNFGILVGAFLAAGLAGRFAPGVAINWRPALAAVLGGLLMGYGARLAFGCNVGAYFSGIASGSLHGWLWLVAALVGTFVGVRLRPWFRLAS